MEDKNNSVLSDEKLESVAGGVKYPEDAPEYDSRFRFKVGDHVELITGVGLFSRHNYTDGGTVTHRGFNIWGSPCYLTSGISSNPFNEYTWIPEDRLE